MKLTTTKKQFFLMLIAIVGILFSVFSLKFGSNFLSVTARAQTAPKPFCEVADFPLGASINESLVNAVVYVDTNGNDANDGSANNPVRSFCRGVALANDKYRAGQTPKVVVRPGTFYGETCGIQGSPAVDGARPFVIEGTEPDKVIISGSKPWTNWSGPDANGVWSKVWTNNWRQEFVAAGDGGADALTRCTPPNGPCAPLEVRRLELIHVDGQKYLPVRDYAALANDTFAVDENADRIYVKPPTGVDLNAPERLVLVLENYSQAIFLYRPNDEITNANLVLRNLTFSHFAGNGPPEWSNGAWGSSAILILNMSNTLIENSRFIGNRYDGLGLYGRSSTVRNSRFIDNGSAGFILGGGEGILTEDSEFWLNGRLASRYNWNGWTSGGIKTVCVKNAVFRRLRLTDNFTQGFWTDTGVTEMQLLDSIVGNNEREGVFQENNNRLSSKGGDGGSDFGNFCSCRREWTNAPTLIVRNTEINFNQRAGLLISEAENTLLDDVELIGNKRAIATYGGRLPDCGPRNGDPFQGIYSGPCRGPLRNFAWKNSTIAATESDQKLFTFDEGGNFNDPRPWQYEIFPGLRLDAVYDTNNNRYFHPNGEAANEFFDQNGVRNKNLATWKTLHASRQNADRDSFWQAPNLPVVNGSGDGLQAVYFNELNFAGTSVSRVDAAVNFELSSGNFPANTIEPDTFSVRWAGEIQARETGIHVFRTVGDDAIRLYLDDILVANDWGATHPAQATDSPRIYLKAGERTKIRLEYSQSYGGAAARLEWKLPSQNDFAVVPQTQLYSSAPPTLDLPNGWLTTDVGSVGQSGAATFSNNAFNLKGSGADVWGTSDGFRFVYQTVSGARGYTLTARVISQTNTNGWAKAGVMIRQNLDANSAHAMTVQTPTNGTAFQRRLTNGANSLHTPGTNTPNPVWVRIRYTGGTAKSFTSTDGATWTQIGTAQTLSLTQPLQIGLVVTSHDNTRLSEAVFDNVTIEGCELFCP